MNLKKERIKIETIHRTLSSFYLFVSMEHRETGKQKKKRSWRWSEAPMCVYSKYIVEFHHFEWKRIFITWWSATLINLIQICRYNNRINNNNNGHNLNDNDNDNNENSKMLHLALLLNDFDSLKANYWTIAFECQSNWSRWR